MYYLINIGTIVFRHGSGQAPIVNTYPSVSSEAESPSDDEIISGPMVNARRDVGELTRIADAALAESADAPTVALMDGTLALWVQTAAIPEAEQDRVQRDYLQQLDRLREAHLPIGAFLSRPRSTNVTQLAYLATFDDPDKALSSVMNDRGPAFKGLRDTTVLATLLQPGQRSALFEVAPAWNTTYRDRGHSIHFFYVNVGTAAQSRNCSHRSAGVDRAGSDRRWECCTPRLSNNAKSRRVTRTCWRARMKSPSSPTPNAPSLRR